MRPCGYELIKGLIYTWEQDVFPIVAKSDQGEVVRRMRGGSIVLRLLAALWEGEGTRAFYGNRELRQGLWRSLEALKKAGLDNVVDEIDKQLKKKYFVAGEYPDLNALLQEADDLKVILENALTAIAGINKPDKSVSKVHDDLCRIMKLLVERDLYLENIVRGDFSHVEKTMDDFIARLSR